MDCSQFNYSTPVSSFVNKTLELEKIRRQGYRNEKEQLEKLRLLAPGLDDLKLQLNVCNFYGGIGLSGRTGPIGFPGKRYPLLEERCYMMYIHIGLCHIAYTSKIVKVVSLLATRGARSTRRATTSPGGTRSQTPCRR